MLHATHSTSYLASLERQLGDRARKMVKDCLQPTIERALVFDGATKQADEENMVRFVLETCALTHHGAKPSAHHSVLDVFARLNSSGKGENPWSLRLLLAVNESPNSEK